MCSHTINRIPFVSNGTIQLEKDMSEKIDKHNLIDEIICRSCSAVSHMEMHFIAMVWEFYIKKETKERGNSYGGIVERDL